MVAVSGGDGVRMGTVYAMPAAVPFTKFSAPLELRFVSPVAEAAATGFGFLGGRKLWSLSVFMRLVLFTNVQLEHITEDQQALL